MAARSKQPGSSSKDPAKVRKLLAVAALLAATVLIAVVAIVKDHDALANAAGVAPPPTAQPAPTSSAASPQTARGRIVIIGDSYAGGSDEGGRGKAGWPNLVEQDLNENGMPASITLAAVGGTGYLQQNDGIDFQKVASKVADTENLRGTNLVIVFGSRNDVTYPPELVGQAAMATYATIQTALPDAKLMVVGPEWQNEDVPPQLLAVRDAVAAAASLAGAEFVDPLTLQWFTSATRDLIGSDNIHPTDAGHRKIAASLYPIIRAALERT